MDMNLANKLTMLRVVMIPAFLLVLFLAPEPMNRYIAVIIFIVASLTDMLDGKIARKYNMVSNFGKFMDPLADKLLVMSALVSMVALKDLAAWVVLVKARCPILMRMMRNRRWQESKQSFIP